MKGLNKFQQAMCFCIAAGFVFAGAQAKTWTVNSNGDRPQGDATNCAAGNVSTCTLRDAIKAAVGGDTIVFNISPNTIQLTNGQLVLAATSGKITIDGSNRPGVENVIVDGNHTSRVFYINQFVITEISNLTIQNGYLTATTNEYGSGAGVYNNGSLMLANVILKDNIAKNLYGGGVFNSNINNKTSITLANCNFSSNEAELGGGIYNANNRNLNIINLDITNSKFNENNADNGGAIYNYGYMVLTRSVISENSVYGSGGAIYNNGGKVFLVGSTLSGNIASSTSSSGGGGGIYTYGAGNLMLVNSTISENSATRGAGIYFNGTSSSKLISSTVARNAGMYGASLYRNSGINISYINTIFGGDCSLGDLSITDNGGNLDQGTSCGLTSAGSKNNAFLNLGLLGDNGGQTETILPRSGSEVIDFTACTDEAPLVDQRGAPRPDSGSSGRLKRCDAGAVEVGSLPSDGIFADGFGYGHPL